MESVLGALPGMIPSRNRLKKGCRHQKLPQEQLFNRCEASLP